MFEFTPRQVPNQIFVIGCGGTGSRLVPLLSQFIRTVTHGVTPRGNVVNPTIFLIDDDVVEHKNLLRQNFIENDVGKPKAAVLASRYSRAYGVNIIPVVRRVSPTTRVFEGLGDAGISPGSNAMVIMCVDSAQARRDILHYWTTSVGRPNYTPSQQPFFIDAGNEDNFGQVRFFNLVIPTTSDAAGCSLSRIPKLTPERVQTDYLPMDPTFYENMRDNEGGSCADLDQTLAINALMATLIMGVVQNFYYVKPFTYHSMSISLNGAVNTGLLTPQYLQGISLQKTDRKGDTGFRYYALRTDTASLIRLYADRNIDKLREMGLRTDGTPIAAPKAPDPVVVEPDEAADDESFVLSAEAVEEAVPEVVVTSSRRSGRRPPAASAATLPPGVTAPPPLVARR